MDEIFEKRKQNYEIVSDLFVKNIKGIRKPEKLDGAEPVWFGNGIICDNKEIKQKLVAYLEKIKSKQDIFLLAIYYITRRFLT